MSGPTDPVVELYELVLQNRSLFGCLIYVANTWNPKTGRYDRALPDRLRTAGADRALANWHRKFFTDWLALPIADKERDLALYWRSIGGSRDGIREIGGTAIPPLVRDEERKLFIQNLTFVLALL